jgi:hypothetical protein
MPVVKELRTAGDHWNGMVAPDFREHQVDQADLRRALHCAVSLNHVADWVYENHEAAVRSAFSFQDPKGNPQPAIDAATFANALEQQTPDFGIANAAKHYKLKGVRPVAHAPSHAANTRVTGTTWDNAAWDDAKWDDPARVVLEAAGGDLDFSQIADNAHRMWLNLNAQHHWW